MSVTNFKFLLQGFLTSIGNRERRLRLALEHTTPFILHGIATSILILLILYFSPFEFIVKHFFFLLIAFWLLCAVNSLFHYPMLLLLFGPAPELIPRHRVDRISTPSPQPKSNINKQKDINLHSKRPSRKKSHHIKNTNFNNEPSLTTITEESSWQSSASSLSNGSYRDGNMSDNGMSQKNFPRVHHNNLQREKCSKNNQGDGITIDTNQPAFKSIIVQPEVIVETHHNGSQQNTKVTATANIKLEFTTGGPSTTTTTTTSSNNHQQNFSWCWILVNIKWSEIVSLKLRDRRIMYLKKNYLSLGNHKNRLKVFKS